jgi:hypothetical protein
MSNQLEEIGRLVTERTAVVKRQSELRREGERFAKMLLGIGGPLFTGLSPDSLRRATSALNDLEKDGGLERLKTVLSDFELQSINLAKLNRSLKDAGVA